MWRKQRHASPSDAVTSDGSGQALDHIANWVRFADTKATVLIAGLGVAMTLLVSNFALVLSATRESWVSGLLVGCSLLVSLCSFLWTLFWLMKAIGPQRKAATSQLNRFSWPALAYTTKADLQLHIASSVASDDAWQQVLELSKLADRKFAACEKAVYGFGSLIVSGFTCVTAAMAIGN